MIFMADSTEIWLPVVGYEGAYEVSNLGRVRSVDRVIRKVGRWGGVVACRKTGKFLALTPDIGKHCYGRLTVKLSDTTSGRPARTRLVSHLVAEAFIGPRPAGMEVAHGNGKVTDNRASNLRYATPAENTADKGAHGTVLRGRAVATAKLNDSAVRMIRASKGSVPGHVAARQFGISQAQVSRIRNGRQWGHL
jgi:hypothetical protein